MKKTYEELRAQSPERMSFEAIQTLSRGYIEEGKTPNDMFVRLCNGFIKYYPEGYKDIHPMKLWSLLYHAFQQCWVSPASPVASNFGTYRALPVSCYGISVPNTIHGIYMANHEAAMLTKNGGGIGVDLSNLIGPSKVTAWARQFDVTMANVSQTGVRRGFVAQYIDIDHPDTMLLLDAKDLAKGDVKQKLACNIAVKITDSFMERLRDGDKEAWVRFSKVFEMGLKYGSPYIMFSDNALRQDPPWYKDKGLGSAHSQLCSEIFLHSDDDHTYSCVLSSMNLRYFNEWVKWDAPVSLPELMILFLDAVCQEFIDRAKLTKHPEGLMKAIRSAEKGRPLGLGVYGYHAWLMKHMIPFESAAARLENHNIFQYIQREAEKATKQLAVEKGEPEWCKGWGRRNTHLLAIAPTTTSSIIGNGVTPGIEPLAGNYFSKFGAKGTFVRKNPYLERILVEKGQNTDRTWASIRDNLGSVQHLDFLSDYEKEVFKTAFEINQMELIQQAGDRQQYIDQGQSLNLFIKPDEDAQFIIDLHVKAWQDGLKSRYYIYSESKMVEIADEDTFVYIKTREDCPYCQKAKELLDELGVQYIQDEKPEGRVPEIWLNGEMLEDGYNSLYEWYYGAPQAAEDNEDCGGCNG